MPDQLPAEMTELDRMQVEVYARKLDKKVRELEKEREAIRRADEELKFRNVILSTQQEASIDGILVVDESNTIISYNQRFVEMWGIPPKLVESKDDEPVLQYVATKPVDPEGFLARVKYLYEHKEEKSHEDIALKDGRVFERYSAPMFGVDGRYYGRVWYFRDITERKRAEEKIKESEETYRNLFQNAQVGLFRTRISDGKILESNEQLAKMFGYDSREEFVAEYKTSGNYVDPETREKMLHEIKNNGFVQNFQARFYRKDGSVFWVSYSAKIYSDKGWIEGVTIDITERKKAEERIEYLAYYDALTGLPNRNLFLDRVNQAIARAEPTSRIVAVLITNIDRFKSINDTYGSEIGDRVLKEIAGRLSTSVRKGDTIARLSNDEFGIALLDVAHPDDIVMVLEKIIKDISYPLNIAGDELALTFSTGVSLYPNDGNSASELLKAAGLALGTAKKERMETLPVFH